MRNDHDFNKLGAQGSTFLLVILALISIFLICIRDQIRLSLYRVTFHQGRKVVSGIFGSHDRGRFASELQINHAIN